MISGKRSFNGYWKLVAKYCLCFFLWVGLLGEYAYPQQSPTDSLLSLLQSDELSEEKRMHIQGQLALSLRYSDPDLCFEYAERAYKLAQRLEFPHHEALYLRYMAVSRSIAEKHLESVVLHQQGIQFAKSIGDTNLIYFHSNLGISLQDLQDYESALEHFQDAIRISDSLGRFRAGIPAMGMLANLHHQLESDSLALQYSKAAIQAAQAYDFSLMLGYGYKDQGNMYLALGHPDSALHSLELAEEQLSPQNTFIKVDILIIKSEAYRKMSRFGEAQVVAEEALELAKGANLLKGESRAGAALAQAFFDTKQYNQALVKGLQALQVLKEQPAEQELVDLYHLLGKASFSNGDTRAAYEYEQQANLALEQLRGRDQEIGKALAKQRLEMTTQSLLAEKEKEISQTVLEMWTKSEAFAWSMGIFAVVVLLVFWLFFFRNRQEGEKAIWHHLTDREIEKRIRFGKQLILGNILLLLPVMIYLLVWGAKEWALIQLATLIFLGSVYLLVSRKSYPYVLVGAMILVYPSLGFFPVLIAPLYSVLLTPIVAIIAFNYFSAKPWHIMLNCGLFFLSFGFSFLLIRQVPSGANPVYSEALDLMVMVILSLIIVSTLIYHNRHISESKRELEDSRHFVEDLTDVNPHWLFAKDLQGKYMFANSAMAEYFGLSKKDLIGKTRSDLGTSQELIELATREDEEILQKGKPLLRRIKRFVVEGGQSQWRQMIKKPLFNDKGEMIGLVGISSDITERVVAEQNLKDRDVMVHHILDSIPDPILALNLEGQPILWNERIDRNLWKARKVDLHKPINWASVFSKNTIQRLQGVLQKVRDGETVEFINVQEVLGQEMILDMSFAPILNTEKEITGVVMVGRDITKQQKQALALEVSQATYKSLFQNIFDAVVLYDYGKESILDVNEAARELFEFPQGVDFTTFHRYDLIPSDPPQMPNVDIIQTSDEHRTQVLQGKAVQTEAVFHTTKGIIFDAEVTILPSGGHPEQALVIIRDVSEAKQAHRELTERRKIYQALIDLSFDGIDIIQIFFDPHQPNTYDGQLLVRNEKMATLLGTEEGLVIQGKEILRRSKWVQPGGVSVRNTA
ncbi:MAG: PAS domain S-box protein [Bacteroidota bacterium]